MERKTDLRSAFDLINTNNKFEISWIKETQEYISSKKENFILRLCPVCKNNSGLVKTCDTACYEWFKCLGCGLWFVPKIPCAEDLELFYNSETYNSYMYYTYQNFLNSENKISKYSLADLICKNSNSNNTLLEIGSGFGDLIFLLKDKFVNVFGVEWNNFCLEKADELFNVKLLDNMDSFLQSKEAIDVIVLEQVIEHLDSFDILHDLVKKLKKNGILWLGTPAIDGISFRLFREKHVHIIPPVHINLFSRKSLMQLGKSLGLKPKFVLSSKFDISFSDFVVFFLNKKNFHHRYNDGFTAFLVSKFYNNLKARKFLGMPLRFLSGRMVSTLNAGSYLSVIFEKETS